MKNLETVVGVYTDNLLNRIKNVKENKKIAINLNLEINF